LLSRRESWTAVPALQTRASRRSEGPCPNSPATDPNTTDSARTFTYGDVHVGTIAERTGNPHDTDPWEWNCGFYPGSHPGEHQSDTTATFDDARADFETRVPGVFVEAPRGRFSKMAR
jgi:hypothetical protein